MNVFEVMNLFARHLHRINDVDIIQMCGLAKGSNAATIKTTADFTYIVANQQVTKAAADNIAMTSCATQPVDTFCYYAAAIDATGAVTIVKGDDSTYAIPDIPFTGNPKVLFGVILVVTDATHTFTSGVTDLAATGITAVFYSIDTGIALTLINQAMRRMERTYNLRHMKVRSTYSLDKGTDTFDNPIPRYKELINVYATTGSSRYPIRRQSIEYVEQKFQVAESGPPQLIAEVPLAETIQVLDVQPDLQWMIRPIPDVDYTVVFTAYQYSPLFDGVTYSSNWWTEIAWDVLLYAALVEASPYLIDDARLEMWKRLHEENILKIVRADRTEQFSGSLQCPNVDNVY